MAPGRHRYLRRVSLVAPIGAVAVIGATLAWAAIATPGPDAGGDSSTSADAAVDTSAGTAPPPPSGKCPPGMAFVPGRPTRKEMHTFCSASAECSRMPGGKFEGKEMEVTIPGIAPFCIDVLEVTVADYRRCVRAGHCRLPPRRTCNYWLRGRARHPHECARYRDAETYCRLRGKRLPTTEEWNLAGEPAGGRRFPWGDDGLPPSGSVCWGLKGPLWTCEVGTSPADVSAWGVHDTLANVWEWLDNPPEKPDLEFRATTSCSGLTEPDLTIDLCVGAGPARAFEGSIAGFRCAARPIPEGAPVDATKR